MRHEIHVKWIALITPHKSLGKCAINCLTKEEKESLLENEMNYKSCCTNLHLTEAVKCYQSCLWYKGANLAFSIHCFQLSVFTCCTSKTLINWKIVLFYLFSFRETSSQSKVDNLNAKTEQLQVYTFVTEQIAWSYSTSTTSSCQISKFACFSF